MQLFAKVENGIVTNVIVASEEVINSGAFGTGWIETWTDTINNPRKNYAGIGYTYDETLNAFIPPQLFPSWILNSDCQWTAPVPFPTNASVYDYTWDESTISWKILSPLL
jgi:hypothetical protein